MRNLIKIEELALFFIAFLGFIDYGGTWYGFLLALFLPDLGMIGYLVNPKLGAITYNLAHHKAVAIAIFLLGAALDVKILIYVGIIMFAHSSIDRALGYGLKTFEGFKKTHLGEIGR